MRSEYMRNKDKRDKHITTMIVAMLIIVVMLLAVVLIIPMYDEEPVARGPSYGWLREETIALSGTGTAGAVTASGNTGGIIHGHIYAVNLDYADTISTTTDLTMTMASPALTILQLTDYYTDTWFYPAVAQTDYLGASTSTYDRLLVSGRPTVTIGSTISSTAICTVTVWWGQ